MYHKIDIFAVNLYEMHTLVDPQLVPSAGGVFPVVQDPPLG